MSLRTTLIAAREIADYVSDLSSELARMARGAHLTKTANSLEDAALSAPEEAARSVSADRSGGRSGDGRRDGDGQADD